MIRFLAGLGAGLIAAAVTSFFTYSEPWLLGVSLAVALVVWFGQRGIEVVADALDDVF